MSAAEQAHLLSDHSRPPTAGWLVAGGKYRPDIDGIRALAVLSVIAYHFGYLIHGYLGVDVFFVISGYLITSIIYRESQEGGFSVAKFYLRRTRRILPLVSVVSVVVLLVGAMVMLPDDLENLCSSIVATNLFSNNILQILTTGNYWDVVNEYKPMLHTWSLGVEEQYYVVYPFLFLLLGQARLKWLPTILIILSVISGALFFGGFNSASAFYLLPFRFFELSLGGLAAVLLGERVIQHRFTFVILLALIAVLAFGLPWVGPRWELVLTVLLSLGLVVSQNAQSRLTTLVLQNRLIVGIGLISFSLYMWHQPVISFARYFVFDHVSMMQAGLLTAIVFALSIFSYYLVEQPFRNKQRVGTPLLLTLLGVSFLVSTSVALLIYFRAGVVRDVPELDLTVGAARRGMHAVYNWRVHDWNKEFVADRRVRVLVIGNSYARDWVNVLLESAYKDVLDISYSPQLDRSAGTRTRAIAADAVFVCADDDASVGLLNELGVAAGKVWCVGVKSFGCSNGIFYNYRGKDYHGQRTAMDPAFRSIYLQQIARADNRYIDLTGKVIDEHGKVPVFTPDRRFISQDCRHLTKAGAQYFALLCTPELKRAFGAAAERLESGSAH